MERGVHREDEWPARERSVQWTQKCGCVVGPRVGNWSIDAEMWVCGGAKCGYAVCGHVGKERKQGYSPMRDRKGRWYQEAVCDIWGKEWCMCMR